MKSYLVIAIALAICTFHPVTAAELRVSPGDSIQEAVNKAKPGDTILVEPGEYKQSVYVDKPNITLRGLRNGDNWAVLDGEKKLYDGIIASGHSIVVEGFYVKGYKGNGIMTEGANNFKIINNKVEGAFYAIFPQYGKNGLIQGNEVSGTEDAGIYVGMNENIDVIENDAHDNVIGLEFENCKNALMARNTVHENTVGILLSLLPGLPIKESSELIVRDNKVINNNHVNFAPASSIAASAPVGVGLFVLATDDVTIESNEFRDHAGPAVVVADQVAFGIATDPKADFYPDNVHILKNTYSNNGRDPRDSIKELLAPTGRTGFQIVVAGKGQGSCVDLANEPIETLLPKRWGKCTPDMSKASVLSAMIAGGAEEPVYTSEQRGRMTYLAVCTGCHAYDSVLHGPSMQSIKALYAENPQGLIAFARKPERKRLDFPEMPAQAYLGDETLKAIADYILKDLGK